MAEIRPDIGVAAGQVFSQDRVDAFLQGVSEPGSLVRELRRLRAENAALKESLTWALNELSFRLGKAWAEKDWEHYGPVVTARALLSPQAAEPPRDDRYDAAHPESEHDGGLGSGDWMGPWEDRR